MRLVLKESESAAVEPNPDTSIEDVSLMPAAKTGLDPSINASRFAPETDAERGLLAVVLDGHGIYDAQILDEAERVVRSDFFRALLTGTLEGYPVPEAGLYTLGLIFKDQLDLT